MKTNDLVSIVIPCHNHAQFLEETVVSAAEQTYSNIEIIIINDGSTDNTEEVARNLQAKYPDKIQVISQKNSGVSVARNNAIGQSKGRYILPLDADDIIDKKMVGSSLDYMKENSADIVYVAIKYFGVKNFTDNKKPFYENHILYQSPCSATSLFKKEIWENIGGYAKNMQEGYEDWEFWVHAYKEGYKFQLLSESLLSYRTQEVSRNINAEVKDAYLKAKITLNHPELYTIDGVNEAISIVRETEILPDLYFYGSSDFSIKEKILANTLDHYLASNKLKKRQLIDILDADKKVGLYALDILKNHKQLKHLHKESGADFILFYAPLNYEVPGLKNLDFAWDKDKGIIETHGNIFPFVFKSRRENCKSQLTAYKRLANYQKEISITHMGHLQVAIENKIKTVEKQESRIQEKNKIIEQHWNTVKDQHIVIKKRVEIIEKQKAQIQEINRLLELNSTTIKDQKKIIEDKVNLLRKIDEDFNRSKTKQEAMMHAVHQVISFPLTKNPIDKYKAYKSMLQIYHNLVSSKYASGKQKEKDL